MPKALVAMSGGVDSAASAILMKKNGFDVCGVTFVLDSNTEDAKAAEYLSKQLGIDHYSANIESLFKENVIDPFIDSYCNGLTPNPCILCNKAIKFGYLYNEMQKNGFDVLATGHYAQLYWDIKTQEPRLHKATEYNKDQTYVLYSVNKDIFKHVVFPLGDKTKSEVRDLVKSFDVDCYNKAESQDICFIKDGNYAQYIINQRPNASTCGNFCDTKGNVLGRHKGLLNYTVGQRRGLGIPSTESYYVISKDSASNSIILGYQNELYTNSFSVSTLNILCPSIWLNNTKFNVRTRYHQNEYECRVYSEKDTVKVITDTALRIPAPGQSAVFYYNDIVVAGGIIV